jgi:PKD repeat protein
MKKLSILTLLLALCCGMMTAQTYNVSVSGQVTDISNGNPIPNYPVDVVLDTNVFFGFGYANTVTTDANGNYSDVIAVPSGVTQGTGWTGLRDCTPAGYPTNSFSYSPNGNVLTNLDFAICTTPTGTCIADFTLQHLMGTTMVDFFDASSAPNDTVTAWSWDFGDGGTSTLQNPSHTYNGMGPYLVCLTIATSGGCSSTHCDSVSLGGSGINCQASLTAQVSPSGVTAFSATGSGTGTIVGYFFDFGDGNTLATSSSSVTHTYLVAGTYTACVFVDFSDSCRASSCTTVTISNALQCQASYYWFPDTTGQYSIILVNTSSGNNLTYSWSFGDGSGSTQAYPSHQYAGPGTYAVCVTVTSQNPACTDTYCDTLVVVNKVSAPFSINVIADGSTTVDPGAGALSDVSISPNPASDHFQVELSLKDAAHVKVSLMDLSGKVVATEYAGEVGAGTQRMRISTQDLPAGLYLARVQAGDSFSTHKVMIAR